MKLTIKDIAKYLPYRISYEVGNEIEVLCSVDSDSNLVTNDGFSDLKENYGGCEPDRSHSLDYVKPILRPLSQLIEEIQHKGKTFVPIVELAKMAQCKLKAKPIVNKFYSVYSCNCHYGEFKFHAETPSTFFSLKGYGAYTRTVLCQELLFQKLYEWHFWTGDQSFFEKGLLIEKKAK